MSEIIPQLIVIALIISSVYALIAAGLTLTFGVLEFVHFGYGEMAMLGAYLFYTAHISLGLGYIESGLISIVGVTILGIIIEKFTFRPVRDRQVFIPLVLSIGIAIILQSIVLIIYGGTTKNLYVAGDVATKFTFFNDTITITSIQIFIILTAITALCGLCIFLKYSKTGKAIRAVSDDKEVAAIMGINVDRTISILFAIGSALAALAGILIGLDRNLTPNMGMLLTVYAFAVIVLGGVGKLKGAIIGAIIIGFIETFSLGLTSLKASSKELVIFGTLMLLLIFKPYGIFGGKKDEIESR
ncbi:branched-chain amino acid ABC transporter permease [Candidatus Peregrinibacteria bacterium]|nr:branched-chain amino acid ABC transporter permease [Candidatus Peregrinibacteria bacterium]